MDEQRTVRELIEDAKRRVERKTFVQDVTEPLTGNVDRRKLASKMNSIEHAVDEIATAVEKLATEDEKKSA